VKLWKKDAPSAKIITIANQKGGVGKTTSTMNLGVAMAKAGAKVLLLDSDPQGNLTSYLGVTPFEGEYEDIRTLDEIFLSKRRLKDKDLESFPVQTPAGVDLIAADQALSGIEYYLFSRSDKELVLKKALDVIGQNYDYILIDTPPSLNLLTINAFCASHSILIPLQPEFFSLEGIVQVKNTIQNIQDRWNPNLSILGILPTQVKARRRLTQEVIESLGEEFGEILFENVIHDNSAITESSGHAKSVMDYRLKSRGSSDYLAAAKELMNRCESEVKA
jgi:chromosome partitioning protein